MPNYCKNCSTLLKDKFCHSCGQKFITINERTLKHLLSDFFHYFSHLDGKFIRTLQCVLFKPGQVTKDISEGITVKHFKISTFFLLGTLIYFLLPQNFIGYGFLNTPYKNQINSGFMSQWKEKEAQEKIKSLHISDKEYSIIYNEKLKNNGKLLTLLLIPFTIPILLIINLFLRKILKNHSFTTYDLTIASLEINSNIVYALFLIIGVIISAINYFFIDNMENVYFQSFNAIFIFVVMILYFFTFFKRAYQLKWIHSLLCTILFFFGYSSVIIAYQFFSFLFLY